MQTFSPKLDMLPPAQRRLWPQLTNIHNVFVLYGGTAISLYLGHRPSVDFGFFANAPFQPNQLLAHMPFLAKAKVTQSEPNTLTLITDDPEPVKISFFGVPNLARLLPPLTCEGNGLQVASLLDLSGTKAAVVQQRAESKDYRDIDAILSNTQIDLPMALGAARAMYGPQFSPLSTLKALSYFEDGDLPTLDKQIRDRLAKAARTVDLEKIPTIPIHEPPQSTTPPSNRTRPFAL